MSPTELLTKVKAADRTAAAELATYVKEKGCASLKADNILSTISAAAADKASASAREGALYAITELCKVVGLPAEPFLIPTLPSILDLYSDKAPAVRTAADEAGKALVALLCPHAVKLVLPQLFEGMEPKRLWQTKVGSLQLLGALTKTAPAQIAKCLPEIVPNVSHAFSDAKPQVKKAATACLTETCSVNGNRDIEKFVPALVSCIANPAEVPECVNKLSATTFVQAVESPTLAIMTPLLLRGLRERSTPVKRKTAIIIDNMAKLVEDPIDAAVFLPRLLPGLNRVKDEVSDPEVRNVAERAHATLLRIGGEGKGDNSEENVVAEEKKADEKVVLKTLQEVIQSVVRTAPEAWAQEALQYVSGMCAFLIGVKDFDVEHWTECVTPYLALLLSAADAEAVCNAFLARCIEDTREKDVVQDDDDEGEELCNCEFSLAYGGKILLNNATLRLKRGKRYGLCGPNGAGKSTLMRAIANGQLDGFPPKEELRTVYVEHDIDSELADTPVVDYIFLDPVLQDMEHPGRELVADTLTSLGFSEEMQNAPVSSLSGGWKMKLALGRAMLMKADIMLLDEPTNHLDVNNVAWLENYLTHLPQVTSIVVSHDSGFLDNVCTDIIHYEGRKLRLYRGNLSEFVKVRPEARSYYELAAASMKFALPEPGFLEGVKSKDRAILKMTRIGFTYAGASKKTLTDVTVQCNLNSRVAVIGANGAGKSTMIKLLTGELEPQEGVVWKHPNLRVAYVAQHAFHHIEQHLDMTPNQYIQWRYQIGEDREGLEKVNRKVSEEEEKKMAQKQNVNGEKRVVDKLVARRKLKKSYEYEVQWVGCNPDQNTWLTRDVLEDMGFGKLVTEIDVKEASRLGMHTKPLTTKNVEKHCADLGLEPEFATHSQMRGLSGGQKVKVVLAAAMWLNPHMLVLDEPTNYLDRESLGALAGAIKEYGGGVIMISHNREFTSALCPETWIVAEGKLMAKGQSAAVQAAQKLEWKREEEMIDALGNVVKIKAPPKKLSRQEQKKKAKAREMRRKAGEVVSESEDEA